MNQPSVEYHLGQSKYRERVTWRCVSVRGGRGGGGKGRGCAYVHVRMCEQRPAWERMQLLRAKNESK